MKLTTSLPAALVLTLASACSTPMGLPRGHDIGAQLKPQPTHRLSIVDATPETFLHRTLLVEATVLRVCQNKGCWMQVEDQGHTSMVRWEAGCGGQYTFPKDSVGKRVLIQGSFYEKTISEADAKHLEEDAGPGVTIPRVTHELNASAVRILDQ